MGKLTVISHSSELFQDRREAGRLLAAELKEYRGGNTVVLGIPRGGIIVAAELTVGIQAELDIILARKLRSPVNEELAMGAVSENGKMFLNNLVLEQLAIDNAYIQREKDIQIEEIRRRSFLIRKVRPKVPLANRVVIVTDDGVATGATTQAALWAARHEKPSKLILAIPVGSGETVSKLAEEADETLCLRTPPFFAAVGQFYRIFSQTSDEEVLKILEEKAGKITDFKQGSE